MPHIADEQAVAPAEASEAGIGRQPRQHRWILPSALALLVVACVVSLTMGVAHRPPLVSSRALPVAQQAMSAEEVPGVARVIPSTDQVLGGRSFPEVNGIAVGLGSLWLTGGDAAQNHILYGLEPVTRLIETMVKLPSRLVINPDDVAVGSGAVWVVVGSSVYRVEPASLRPGAKVTRAFATLPDGGLIGDVVVDAGSVWVTDTTRGRVYRFAISSGRLEAAVSVGATAGAMAVGDGGVWVADENSHRVSRISVLHNRVDSVLTVPGVPSHIAASHDGLWVTDSARGIVTALDGTSGRALTVRVGRQPTGVAAIGDTVWVANSSDGTLSRIDARRHVVVATVPVGARPYAIAADRRGVWVALLGTVTMHAPSGPSSSLTPGVLARLEQLCGGRL